MPWILSRKNWKLLKHKVDIIFVLKRLDWLWLGANAEWLLQDCEDMEEFANSVSEVIAAIKTK